MNKELAYVFSTRIKERLKEKNMTQRDLVIFDRYS